MNMQIGAPFVANWFLIVIVGIAVVTGIVFIFRALANRSGAAGAWMVAGMMLAVLISGLFSFRIAHEIRPAQVARESHEPGMVPSRTQPEHGEPEARFTQKAKPIVLSNDPDTDHERAPSKTLVSGSVETEAKPTGKPAWLTQGTQTGNGQSQFPVSSELFATAAECQKDLDSRMPGLIANEVRYLTGEEFPISLAANEAASLSAETFTEEVSTSQGTWYRIHRLVKIDPTMWTLLRSRFQQARLYARLEMLGLSFGGLMLVLGVVYLVLRRAPRVVDPTLETFSTT